MTISFALLKASSMIGTWPFVCLLLAWLLASAMGSFSETETPSGRSELLSCDVCAVFAHELRLSLSKRNGAYLPDTPIIAIRLADKYLNPLSSAFFLRRAMLKMCFYTQRGTSHLRDSSSRDPRGVAKVGADLRAANAVEYHRWANFGEAASKGLFNVVGPSTPYAVGMGHIRWIRVEPSLCDAFVAVATRYTLHTFRDGGVGGGAPRRGVLVAKEVPNARDWGEALDDAHAFRTPVAWYTIGSMWEWLWDVLWFGGFGSDDHTSYHHIPAPTSAQLFPVLADGEGDGIVIDLLMHSLFGTIPHTDSSIPGSCFVGVSPILGNLSSRSNPAAVLAKLDALAATSSHLLQEEVQQALLPCMPWSEPFLLGPVSPATVMDVVCKSTPSTVMSPISSPNPSSYTSTMCFPSDAGTDGNDDGATKKTGVALDDQVALLNWFAPISSRSDAGPVDGTSWISSPWSKFDSGHAYYLNFYLHHFGLRMRELRAFL